MRCSLLRSGLVLGALLVAGSACLTNRTSVEPRPAEWAVAIERPGLPNLHRQSATHYRGAQPKEKGWRALEELGVKSVLSLREHHDDELPGDSTLLSERIEFDTLHPEDEHVVRFLRFVADPAHQPVFVHCAHGADRTGTMLAVARIVFDGWSREEALREMRAGGYDFHAWNVQLVRYVRYVRATDFAKLAREAGVEPKPAR